MPCYICRNSQKAFENKESNVKFHLFPTTRPAILREWKKFAGIPENSDVGRIMLCTKHFKREDVISTPIKTRLLKTAIPCLYPSEDDTASIKTLGGKQVLEDVGKQLCRVCGKRESSLQPIFEMPEESDSGVTLPVKIEMYLPIKVVINDGLPSNICLKCSDSLHNWHELHVTCLSADSALRKIFCDTTEEESSDLPCESTSDTDDRVEDSQLIFQADDNGSLEADDNESLEADVLSPECESTITEVPFEEKIYLKSEDKHSDLFPNNKPVNYMKPFLPSCLYCHEFFYYSDDHRNHVHECQNLPTLCDVCGEHVSERKQLSKHKKKHVQKKIQSFICEKCAECLPSIRALQYHLKTAHVKRKPSIYYCEPCCKVIYTKFYYQLHMKKHALGKIKSAKFNCTPILKNKNSAVYLCPVCDEVFGDKLALIVHLSAQKLLNCPTCQKDFQNEKSFVLHKCRKWYCHDCAEPYKNKHALESHLLLHKKSVITEDGS